MVSDTPVPSKPKENIHSVTVTLIQIMNKMTYNIGKFYILSVFLLIFILFIGSFFSAEKVFPDGQNIILKGIDGINVLGRIVLLFGTIPAVFMFLTRPSARAKWHQGKGWKLYFKCFICFCFFCSIGYILYNFLYNTL